ncbi:hypothetical protein [Flavobacterium lacus]|uniref:Secreted protein n=1 Tax=Flavobacterium lacus TaxID=1353778 RepID=A0A328WVP8_9FLAO|nr:hypothetical protein [Flavobacterium lacus]RAR50440.1 hypothetical protein B0I10_102244 [Flavobacterium lacus]
MKNNIITALLFIFFISVNAVSQSNQTTINYSLGQSLNGQVGGDLVIDGNATTCTQKNGSIQNLFETPTNATVFIDINNQGGGNSCVALVVETATGRITTVIPEDSQSGVMRFNRVRRAYLTMSSIPRDTTVRFATSIGTATIWF